MTISELDFEGIVLQPVSRKMSPWNKYHKDRDNFLDFFQNEFYNEIQNSFYVKHKTEDLENKLLVPYFTDTKECFGAYYIESTGKATPPDSRFEYKIDYAQSFNFKEAIKKEDIINEVEFLGNEFEESGSLDYYSLQNPSKEVKDFIRGLCKELSIE